MCIDCGSNIITIPSGSSGDDGISSYIFVGFASDNIGTNFSLDPTDLADPCYINFLTKNNNTPPVLAEFTADGSGWVKICGDDGTSPTTSSTFSSGSGAPMSTGTAGDVYLDITTGTVYSYNGTTWVIVPFAYTITAWTNINLFSPYDAGASMPKFRQQGGVVVTSGIVSTASPTVISSDVLIYTYPVGYRPTSTKYFPIWDNFSGVWGVIRIETNGNATLMGSKIPIYNGEIYLDLIDFELT